MRYIPGEPLLRSNSGKGAMDDTDQVADAFRISPPRIDQMHPDAARLSLSGKLDGRDVDLCSISSPTHPTAVRPVGDDFEIFLPMNASVPDRDFVLRWRHAARPDLLPVAWISSDQKETYALIQLRAPDDGGKKEVALEEMAGCTLGLDGVPFFIFNGTPAFSGAQDPETFLEAFRYSIPASQ